MTNAFNALIKMGIGAVVGAVYVSLLVMVAAPIPLLFLHGHPVLAIAYAVAVYAATYLIPSKKAASHD